MPDPRAIQFDHLSFNLPDEDALLALRDRLKAAGCEVTDVVDHGFIRSIYFTDPNGIALEASWWTLDATGRAADYGDERLFGDADPVPAVDELRESGRARQRARRPTSSEPRRRDAGRDVDAAGGECGGGATAAITAGSSSASGWSSQPCPPGGLVRQ